MVRRTVVAIIGNTQVLMAYKDITEIVRYGNADVV